MSDLYDKLSASILLEEKAQIIWEHYLSRKLPPPKATQEIDLDGVEGSYTHITGSLEPNWIHYGYELLKKALDGEKQSKKDFSLVDQIIESHSFKDGHLVPAFPGQPQSPLRVIHDGWKAGTPTWIFMGRALTADSAVHLGGGWVAVQRTLPEDFYKDLDQDAAPATLWMAYHMDKQMGMTALTSNVIGPAVSFDDLWAAVDAEHGPLYKSHVNQKFFKGV